MESHHVTTSRKIGNRLETLYCTQCSTPFVNGNKQYPCNRRLDRDMDIISGREKRSREEVGRLEERLAGQPVLSSYQHVRENIMNAILVVERFFWSKKLTYLFGGLCMEYHLLFVRIIHRFFGDGQSTNDV